MENGISLSGVLTVVFVVLKLVGVIDWSWWWVLSPVWIPSALWLAIIGVAYLAALIIILLRHLKSKKAHVVHSWDEFR